MAQQVLALCLQEGRIGDKLWPEWLPLPGLLGDSAGVVVEYLVAQGFVQREDGMLFIGPEAERRFGMRHFMGLMATFTAPPEFTVLHGRGEIGRTDRNALAMPEAAAAALRSASTAVPFPAGEFLPGADSRRALPVARQFLRLGALAIAS